MKRNGFLVLLLTVCIVFYAASVISTPTMGESATQNELQYASNWVEKHFARDTIPPFSFVYDGKKSTSFLSNWNVDSKRTRLDDKKTQITTTFSDPITRLVVYCHCLLFSDYPAVEWVVEFENKGDKNTPILENIQAVEVTLFPNQSRKFILYHALGSGDMKNDFGPLRDEIMANSEIKLAPTGGRSSDKTALPFFNIQAENSGVMVAIGWSGQWQAIIGRKNKGIFLRSGMELTHLKLYPNEKIRTPRILLLFWEGADRIHGHNLFRQFILAHHTPQKDGAPIVGPLACNGGAKIFKECTLATEYNQIALAERFKQFGLETEYWWIDAGWYGSTKWHSGDWYANIGNWYIRKEHFPNGLKPVSDAVNKMGMKLILWFAPEPVYQGTWLDREHPEWVLHEGDEENTGLLNLGNPQARQWVTDYVSNMIKDNGIAIYRQDFNIRPLSYWRAADEPDRQGITEIRHIEGLYTLWDELLKRHPGLIIDNCASGGGRLDLETISRSIPLWRSDYSYTEPNGRQNHTYGLHLYLPCNGTGCLTPNIYAFRSAMSSSLACGWNLYKDNFPKDLMRYLLAEYKKVRPYFFGNYYPLTEYSISNGKWLAYQFHRRDLKQGMVLAFRRPKCKSMSKRIKLFGLEENARYKLTYHDCGIVLYRTGRQLMDGFEIKILQKPGSMLITYEQQQ